MTTICAVPTAATFTASDRMLLQIARRLETTALARAHRRVAHGRAEAFARAQRERHVVDALYVGGIRP